MNGTSGRYTVEFSSEEHCYIFRSTEENQIMSLMNLNVAKVIRILLKEFKDSEKYSRIAKFCNLSRPNQVFRLAYTGHLNRGKDPAFQYLRDYLVFDLDNSCVKFYDYQHKPDNADIPHVDVSIVRNGDGVLNVTEQIPAKVTTRFTINDPLNRYLTMSITPTSGHILGVNDLNLCNPNVPYFVYGQQAALNDLLRKIHFVGTSAGSGRVVVTVDDGENTPSSKQSAQVDLTIEANVKVSIPELHVPEEAIDVQLAVDTPITPAVTVSDEDGKILALRIYSYHCDVYGWKKFGGYISHGQSRVTTGRPEAINDDIANLFVRAKAANAQLGVELITDKTVIRDYIILNVTDAPATDDDGDDELPPTKVVPELNATAIGGNINQDVPFTGSFTTEGVTDPVTIRIEPTGCNIKNYGGETIVAGGVKNDSADISAINTKLANALVNIIAPTGKIIFTWDNGNKTKTINVNGTPKAILSESRAAPVVPSTSVVPELSVSDLVITSSDPVPLNASFSVDGVVDPQSVSITPTGCSLRGLPKVKSGSGAMLSGTISDINSALAKTSIVAGNGNGSVKISWNNGKNSTVIKVTKQLAKPENTETNTTQKE